jgi:hypothetical protein
MLLSLFDIDVYSIVYNSLRKNRNTNSIIILIFLNSNISNSWLFVLLLFIIGGNGSLFRGSIASIWKRKFVSGWSSCPERRFVHSSRHGRCPRRGSNHHRGLVRWRMVWNIFILLSLSSVHTIKYNKLCYIFQMLILVLLRLRFPFSFKNIKWERKTISRAQHPSTPNRRKSVSSVMFIYIYKVVPVDVVRETFPIVL